MPDETPKLPSKFRGVNPEDLLARGMRSIKMTKQGAVGWVPPPLEKVAQLFPGYEIIAMTGHAGMGAVYQARQIAQDRLVSLKLLPVEISQDESFSGRFVQEARAMAKLEHPNIIGVHDFGQTADGHLFFAMDYVEGSKVRDLIKAGTLSAPETVAIVTQICDVLSYAHEEGVIHRDLKPDHLVIDQRGRVKIADFGLARLTSAKTKQEWASIMMGVVRGTAEYMSPEQKRGEEVGLRSDIYSLGVILYEMLTGTLPEGAFEPPSKKAGVDKRLDQVVFRAMSQQAEKRFQSADEMKTALQATSRPTASSGSKNRTSWIATGLGLAAAIAVAGWYFSRQPGAPSQATAPAAPAPAPSTPVAPLAPRAAEVPPAPPVVATAEPPPVASVATPPPPTVAVVPAPAPPPPAELAKTPMVEPAPGANPQSEIETWLAKVDAQFQAPYEREVKAPYASARTELKDKYLAVISAQMAAASQAARLEDSVFLRDERQRIFDGTGVPPDDSDKPMPALVGARAAYRTQFRKIEQDHARLAKAHFDRYDKYLSDQQNALTQRQRFDDALLLKKKRDEVAKEWLPATAVTASALASPSITTPRRATPVPPGSPVVATKASAAETAEWLVASGAEVFSQEGPKEVRVLDTKMLANGKNQITRLILEGPKLRTPITHTELKRLATLKMLRNLEIRSLEAPDESYAFLRQLENLDYLNVSAPLLTDGFIEHVAGHAKLRTLRLNGAKNFSGKTLDRLDNARDLRVLELEASGLTSEAGPALGKLNQLEELNLTRCAGATDALMPHLAALTKLERLNLNGTPVTVKGLASIKNLRNLISVGILDAKSPSFNEMVKEVGTLFPKIVSWRVNGDVTAETLEAMGQIRQLERLVLTGKPEPGALAAIAKLPKVDKLVMTNGERTEAELEPIAQLTKLKSIEVNGKGITDAFLEKFKHHRSLKEFKLINTSVTPQAMAAFEKQVSGCKVSK